MIGVRWQGGGEPIGIPYMPRAAGPVRLPVHPAKVILRQVAEKHGLTVDELLAPTRTHPIAHARHEAMWLMRQTTSMSFPEIARRCGLNDHTSAIHGVNRHQQRLDAKAVAA